MLDISALLKAKGHRVQLGALSGDLPLEPGAIGVVQRRGVVGDAVGVGSFLDDGRKGGIAGTRQIDEVLDLLLGAVDPVQCRGLRRPEYAVRFCIC